MPKMKPPRDDQWMTTAEVADQLRIDPDRVVAWIKAGQLVAVNIGDGAKPRFRVSPGSLADFLEHRRPNPPTPRPRARQRRRTNERKYYV